MALTALRHEPIVNRAIDQLAISRVADGAAFRVETSDADAVRWPFLVVFARTGTARVRGRLQLDLTSDDFVVLGNRAPIEVRASPGAEVLVLLVPAAALGPQASRMQRAEGVVWSTVDGGASIVGHLLRGLADQPDDYVPANPGQLAHHVVGLMALLCSDVEPHVDRHGREGLLQSAKEFVEAHLVDLELGPEMIAGHINVSTRTLHRMFEAEGLTVRGWIRSRRLEHCRVELGDKASAHVPVSSVGSRWGLWDAAHFSRLFKSAYGLSPRAYRTRVLADNRSRVGAPAGIPLA